MNHSPVIYDTFVSCFGDLIIATMDDAVCFVGVGWDCIPNIKKRFSDFIRVESGKINKEIVCKVLSVVENGNKENIPKLLAGTQFQIKVWSQLLKINPGTTATYKQIAEAIGSPKSYRAVANACGENPLCVIIPCHRIVGSNGYFGGYRYGIDMKKKLLSREAIK